MTVCVPSPLSVISTGSVIPNNRIKQLVSEEDRYTHGSVCYIVCVFVCVSLFFYPPVGPYSRTSSGATPALLQSTVKV